MNCTAPILLVEDSQDDVDLTLRAFRKQNVANPVVVVRDGVEALDYLHGREGSEPGALPLLVLLDINLPRLGGIEVLRRLRAHARTSLLNVVVLTSSKEDEDVVASYELRANSYIRKPVDFDQFVDVIGHLGLYWLLLNQPPPVPAQS
ncbi:Response regulator receiver domain-containing protein [Verrucomicrobium sp. GAS474]|uniref:response regulator n=1 Tax=Verrucomicrobium sp. GAS474 TaxID=1882831 RepID=UPI00087D675B|nr:response regulator [Verrucomicrobium sp. GAS474]SDT91755.1 Response regulator receiver domain-containing protein [Verrucomicrobium sp. GAS474]